MATVRMATERDAEQLAVLTAQLGYPSSQADMIVRMKEIDKRPEHQMIVAADEHDTILGYIHLEERFLVERNPLLQVAAIVVSEAHRGGGVGKLLMQQAENHARKKGLDIILNTNIRREGAHRFYENLNYNKASTSYRYEKRFPRDAAK